MAAVIRHARAVLRGVLGDIEFVGPGLGERYRTEGRIRRHAVLQPRHGCLELGSGAITAEDDLIVLQRGDRRVVGSRQRELEGLAIHGVTALEGLARLERGGGVARKRHVLGIVDVGELGNPPLGQLLARAIDHLVVRNGDLDRRGLVDGDGDRSYVDRRVVRHAVQGVTVIGIRPRRNQLSDLVLVGMADMVLAVRGLAEDDARAAILDMDIAVGLELDAVGNGSAIGQRLHLEREFTVLHSGFRTAIIGVDLHGLGTGRGLPRVEGVREDGVLTLGRLAHVDARIAIGPRHGGGCRQAALSVVGDIDADRVRRVAVRHAGDDTLGGRGDLPHGVLEDAGLIEGDGAEIARGLRLGRLYDLAATPIRPGRGTLGHGIARLNGSQLPARSQRSKIFLYPARSFPSIATGSTS